MNELELGENFCIPSFLLMASAQPEGGERDMRVEDFLEDVKAWAGFHPHEDCAE